jgi:hypothetical protein
MKLVIQRLRKESVLKLVLNGRLLKYVLDELSYRDNNGSTEDIVNFNNFDVNRNFTDSSVRSNIGTSGKEY